MVGDLFFFSLKLPLQLGNYEEALKKHTDTTFPYHIHIHISVHTDWGRQYTAQACLIVHTGVFKLSWSSNLALRRWKQIEFVLMFFPSSSCLFFKLALISHLYIWSFFSLGYSNPIYKLLYSKTITMQANYPPGQESSPFSPGVSTLLPSPVGYSGYIPAMSHRETLPLSTGCPMRAHQLHAWYIPAGLWLG